MLLENTRIQLIINDTVKKAISTSRVPVGGTWTYVNPENGFVIRHPYFNEVKKMAKAHRAANNFPIGLEFDDQFEENICANAAEGTCFDFTPPTLGEKMASLGRALMNAARSGFKTVSQEMFLERKTICEGCNWYGGSTKLLKVACKRCGCSGLKISLLSSRCPLEPPKW